MGRYITWTDVVGRYPDASKFAGAEGVGSHYLTHAEAEVDGRLSVRYVTPFANTPAPTLVQDLCIDLTYYKLTWRQKDAASLYEYIKDRIAAIQSGTIALPASLTTPSAAELAWCSNAYRTSFGPDNEVEWEPDPQAIIDAELSRL